MKWGVCELDEGRRVDVVSPASSANVGPGFDLCALALGNPSCRVSVEFAERDSLDVRGGFAVPGRVEDNKVFNVIAGMRAEYGLRGALRVSLDNSIPVGKGLGSSGASCAGAAVALNELFGLGMGKEELVRFASLGETGLSLNEIESLGGLDDAIERGLVHLDNVSASIFGGLAVVTSFRPLKVKTFAFPECELILVLPERAKPSTEFARKVLPGTIARNLEIANRRNLSGLLCGVFARDARAVIDSLEEFVVEPARSVAGLLPNYAQVRQAAIGLGFGAAVSGAGPSILIVGEKGDANVGALLARVHSIFSASGVGFDVLRTSVYEKGASVVSHGNTA